jgi:hypothetical protein
LSTLPAPDDLALSDERLDAIFARHIQPALDSRQRFPHSTIVTVMGPAAAGKTTLARVMPERLGVSDPYIVDADDYVPLHPAFHDLRDQHGEFQARNLLGQTNISSGLFDRAVAYGLANGRNLAIAGPMTSPDWVAEQFTAWRGKGARIHAVAVAIHEARSLLGIVDRYRQQVQATGHGRWVEPKWHDMHYSGILDSLERIERDGLADSVHIVPRSGQSLYDNVLLSVSSVTWRVAPSAATAVRDERARLWSDEEHADFHRRATAVSRFAGDGGLTSEEGSVVADAIRRGLPPNEQAVAMLRQEGDRTGDPDSADQLIHRAERRAAYNNDLSAIAQRLQLPATSTNTEPTLDEQGHDAARIAFQGRPATSSSAGPGLASTPHQATSGRPPQRAEPDASSPEL